MWRIGGHILIERLGERVGEWLSFPVNMVSQGTEQPTFEQFQQYALARAEEFLGILEDTDSGHRADYGEIGNAVVVFAVFHF